MLTRQDLTSMMALYTRCARFTEVEVDPEEKRVTLHWADGHLSEKGTSVHEACTKMIQRLDKE